MVKVGDVEWWDRAEVAAYLGVEPDTVGAYRSRGQMPEPTYFGRSPMWLRTEIEKWAAGRR
jgi:predicted DNA-binding transcriptional regulator AlpA